MTLHLRLEVDRQPVPDVPAVYFVAPTENNIDRIAKDLSSGLYDTCYLNFTPSLPRPLLENLAEKLVKANASDRVAKVL